MRQVTSEPAHPQPAESPQIVCVYMSVTGLEDGSGSKELVVEGAGDGADDVIAMPPGTGDWPEEGKVGPDSQDVAQSSLEWGIEEHGGRWQLTSRLVSLCETGRIKSWLAENHLRKNRCRAAARLRICDNVRKREREREQR